MTTTMEVRAMAGRERRYPTKADGCPNVGFYTLREVRLALRVEVDRLQEQGDLRTETSRGMQVPDKTDLLNWLIAGFFGLSVPERDRLLRAGKRRFERIQDSEPGSIDALAPDQADEPPHDVKGLPGRRHPRKDGGHRKDVAPVADHRPGV